MTPIVSRRLHRSAAIAFLAWGGIHLVIASILLAIRLFGPADAFEDVGIPASTSPHVQALILQNNVSMIVGSLVVVATALAYGWRGFMPGYWLMAAISTIFATGLLLELVPGHLPWSQGIVPLGIWVIANTLGLMSHRNRKGTPRVEGMQLVVPVASLSGRRLRRATGVAYVAWALLHLALVIVFMSMLLLGPADAFEDMGIPADTTPHARVLMLQNNLTLLSGSLAVLVGGFYLGWRGSSRAPWLAAGVSSHFMLIFLGLELVPGHVPWAHGAAPLVVWALANGLAAYAFVSRASALSSGESGSYELQ